MANNSLITLSLGTDGVELTEFGLEGGKQSGGGFGDPNVIGSTGGDDLFILRDEDITSRFQNIGTGDTSALAGQLGAANFDVVTGTDQDQTNNLIRIGKVLFYNRNQNIFGQGGVKYISPNYRSQSAMPDEQQAKMSDTWKRNYENALNKTIDQL